MLTEGASDEVIALIDKMMNRLNSFWKEYSFSVADHTEAIALSPKINDRILELETMIDAERNVDKCRELTQRYEMNVKKMFARLLKKQDRIADENEVLA